MKKAMFPILGLMLIALLSGCMTAGSFLSQNVTNVELSEPNFHIAAKNVEGYSDASYVLGFSLSYGPVANTFALARVGGTAKMYDQALKDLWNNYEAQYGDRKGKNLVLANIRTDSEILNLFVYTQTKLYITADIIEFKE
jgi:hypothetical protein